MRLISAYRDRWAILVLSVAGVVMWATAVIR
jgi:hypothetical protein